MKSPCSVPEWLRGLIPLETDRQQRACLRHDDVYAVGGSRTDRFRADLYLGLDLINAGMAPDLAEIYVWGVRLYGHTHWNGDDGPGALPRVPPTTEAP